MALLSRDDILNANDAVTEDIEVPEWGGTVRVRGLSGAERDRFEESLYTGKGKTKRMTIQNVRARLVSWTVVDEKGRRIFNRGDVEALGKKSAAALDRVFEVASRLAGIGDDDLDDFTENFPDDPSDDSTSA